MYTHLSQSDPKPYLPVYGPAGMLFVDDDGEGSLPVLFAHSFCGNTTNWKHQLDHLRDKRRAIAFDFRSHGKSDKATDPKYTAEDLALDIASVADGLELNRFVLVGHSMGGAAAIAYAGKYPERVAGLIMAGTPGKSEPEMAKQILAALESGSYEKEMEKYMGMLLSDSDKETSESAMQEMKKIDKDTSLGIIKSLFWYNPMPDLMIYKGPKLVISTSREKEQPNSLMHQRPDIPNKAIEGTSHWMQMDKPKAFNKILDEFIENEIG